MPSSRKPHSFASDYKSQKHAESQKAQAAVQAAAFASQGDAFKGHWNFIETNLAVIKSSSSFYMDPMRPDKPSPLRPTVSAALPARPSQQSIASSQPSQPSYVLPDMASLQQRLSRPSLHVQSGSLTDIQRQAAQANAAEITARARASMQLNPALRQMPVVQGLGPLPQRTPSTSSLPSFGQVPPRPFNTSQPTFIPRPPNAATITAMVRPISSFSLGSSRPFTTITGASQFTQATAASTTSTSLSHADLARMLAQARGPQPPNSQPKSQ